jgi:hypothetical protein
MLKLMGLKYGLSSPELEYNRQGKLIASKCCPAYAVSWTITMSSIKKERVSA